MSETPDKKKSPPQAEGPEALRRRREKLDRELIALLNRRAELAVQTSGTSAAEAGAATHQPHAIPPAFDSLPADAEAMNEGPLDLATLQNVYRELASGWRKLQRKTQVAFLGPAYTYSHLAVLSRFGQSIDQVPVGSISAVFEEVNRGQADFGVVPVENSTDGRVADTLDMFTRLRVRVCGEVPLAIHHSLLGVGPRAGITEVHSKPQALSQCRNWLSRHLPEARLVEVASTIAAAQTARSRPEVAAVAGAQAAAVYGLNLLAENIEDNQSNVTRFFVIGEASAARTGRDKLSVMFEVPHKPGALADAMNAFKRAKLNLTWIESFPIARPEGGYMFFVELDGHETDLKVRNALKSLEKKTLRLEVLGSYAKAEPVG
ncbi:MAG: prephenate dehydratase [Planctomycetia bacterium]|nr:prephenate dehydratase [Planctomycetia bacterium]